MRSFSLKSPEKLLAKHHKSTNFSPVYNHYYYYYAIMIVLLSLSFFVLFLYYAFLFCYVIKQFSNSHCVKKKQFSIAIVIVGVVTNK